MNEDEGRHRRECNTDLARSGSLETSCHLSTSIAGLVRNGGAGERGCINECGAAIVRFNNLLTLVPTNVASKMAFFASDSNIDALCFLRSYFQNHVNI